MRLSATFGKQSGIGIETGGICWLEQLLAFDMTCGTVSEAVVTGVVVRSVVAAVFEEEEQNNTLAAGFSWNKEMLTENRLSTFTLALFFTAGKNDVFQKFYILCEIFETSSVCMR